MRRFITVMIANYHWHLNRNNLLVLLLVISVTLSAQVVFEPDEYSVFQDSVFEIKAKFKTRGELKGKAYTYKGTAKDLRLFSKDARFGISTHLVMTKLQQFKTTVGKKVIYSSTTRYSGYDTSSHNIHDTIFNTRTYTVHNEYNQAQQIISQISITSAGDTVRVLYFRYDSLGRLSKYSHFTCSSAGYDLKYDSVNGFSSFVKLACTDRNNNPDLGDTYSYQTDAKKRITLIQKKHGYDNETRTNEIHLRYSHRGRKQYRIYLYPKYNYRLRVEREKPNGIRIPKKLPFKQNEFTELVMSYSVLRFDSKKRIKSYRYHYKGGVLMKKFRYR
ncbi:MAG: hypothetical protein IT236_18795 [Bacteroidia bacterium]|nr:hypothetical protein [Bacteroidia bacterium]